MVIVNPFGKGNGRSPLSVTPYDFKHTVRAEVVKWVSFACKHVRQGGGCSG